MGLLKNLYFDFSGITSVFSIFSRKKKEAPKPIERAEVKFTKELPSVASGLKRETVSHESKPQEVPKELPKIAERYEKELPRISSYSLPPAVTKPSMNASPLEISGNSFFSNLLYHIDREEAFMHERTTREVVFKNLFSEMKGFWEEKKQVFDRDIIEAKLRDDLKKRVLELRDLEVEWQKLQIKYERTEAELEDKERAIDIKIKELKKIFLKFYFEENVPPEKAFRLCTGDVLSNLNDLIAALGRMDHGCFSYHVNSSKNDFASWIRDVMQLDRLAAQSEKAGSKEELIGVLDSFYNS